MNPWDIDPNLYASLWKLLHDWYTQRKLLKAKPVPDAGCRA